MTARELAGYILIPLLLLLTAWVINELSLWSSLAGFTVPWLCSATALATLVVGVTCLVSQRPPSQVPTLHAVAVTGGVLVILGVGLILDYFTYPHYDDWQASAGEWVGFAVILGGMFCLSRKKG